MTFAAIDHWALGDEPGFNRWLIEHYMEHLQFQEGVQALGYVLPSYPIQRMDDPVTWLDVHHKTHQAIWTAIGGGVSSDLATVDWANESQVYNWMDLHAQVHGDVRTSLGI